LSPLFSFTTPPPTTFYTLSLHDALPISRSPIHVVSHFHQNLCLFRHPHVHARTESYQPNALSASHLFSGLLPRDNPPREERIGRSEEHTSELQSRFDLVCRLLLEKKKKK